MIRVTIAGGCSLIGVTIAGGCRLTRLTGVIRVTRVT